MRSVNIGIISPQKYVQRTMDIVAGRYKPSNDEPKIWFSSMKSCYEILCEENINLLKIIELQKPKTLKELTAMSGRAQSNLSRTLKKLEKYKLVEVKKEKNKYVSIYACFTNFNLNINIEDNSNLMAS